MSELPNRKYSSIAIAVIVYVVLIRLIYQGLAELIPEEAYYWLYAKHLDYGYLDHPPMVAWLISLGTGLFGTNEFGVRIGASFAWVVGAIFIYRLANLMFDHTRALVSVALFAMFPYTFGAGLIMSPDAPLIACWVGALYYFYRALQGEEGSSWLKAGTCVGFGLLSKYTIVLTGVSAILVILFRKESRKWLARPEPYMGALLSIFIFLPVIVWNAQHDWASFAFQSTRRVNSGTHFALQWVVLNFFLLATPVGALSALKVLGAPSHSDQKSRFDPLFVRTFALVPLLLFGVYSVRHVPKLNWIGPSFLPLIPLIADEIVSYSREAASRYARFVHSLWMPIGLLWLIGIGVLLHYLSVGIGPIPYSPKMHRAIGWRSLEGSVEAAAKKHASETGEKPFVVGMDKHNVSAELAFYLSKNRSESVREVSGRHLFGKDSLMFSYWNPPSSVIGRDAILVGRTKEDVEIPQLEHAFESLEPVFEIPTEKGGWKMRTYFGRIARSYKENTFSSGFESEDDS